jgi:hypothetical protein
LFKIWRLQPDSDLLLVHTQTLKQEKSPKKKEKKTTDHKLEERKHKGKKKEKEKVNKAETEVYL